MVVLLGFGAAAVVLLAFALTSSIKIAKEYQRLVVFRLGRANSPKGPGLVFINPVTDRTNLVDLREQYLEIPHQTAITKDNASISIDFIMFYKVFDPVMSVVEVKNFSGAALNIAATTLRSVVGEMPLDDVLSKREEMNLALRVKLDEVTERWGVKVTNVEVREINPPPAVQDAMTRQMSAERSRRAAVTESEGQKQAAVTIAEGQKLATVLAAEAKKQSSILAAEGDRESALIRATGLANALSSVTETARSVDSNTMLLQYLDTLKEIGSSPSTKILLPMELTNLLSGVQAIATASGEAKDTSSANGTVPLQINGSVTSKNGVK